MICSSLNLLFLIVLLALSFAAKLSLCHVHFFGVRSEVHLNSGLYYYGYRFYEPNLQRWVNQDPIGEMGGVNLYGFVENDPENLIDLFGLTTWVSQYPFSGQENGYGPYTMEVNDGINGFRTPTSITKQTLQRRALAAYNELQRKSVWQSLNPNDEKLFDIGFWKGDKNSDRIFYTYCGKNYADNEINYYGIGMYENWAGDPKCVARLITWGYKHLNGWESPNANTYFWLEKGYDDYSNIKQDNNSHE